MISGLHRCWRGVLFAATAALMLATSSAPARADVLSDAGKCIAGYAKASMDPGFDLAWV
jgi:hypothetical protein